MQIELDDFQNGKPFILKGTGTQKISKQINLLRIDKKYKDILVMAEKMEQGSQKYLLAANALLHMHDWRKLIEYCGKGLKHAQESQFYNLMGKAYGKLGDSKKKVELISQAVKINPKVAAYYRNLGAALYSLKKYEQAIKSHQTAIQIQPDSPINYHNKGAAYFRLGDFSQAKLQFSKAIQKNPNQALSYSWMGDSHREMKQHDKALDCYKRAYEISGSEVYLKQQQKMEKIMKPQPHAKKKGFFGLFSSD